MAGWSSKLTVLLGSRGWAPTLAVGLAGFAVGGAVRQLLLAVGARGLRGLMGRSSGGMVVHIGVAVVAVAFACSSAFVRNVSRLYYFIDARIEVDEIDENKLDLVFTIIERD